MRERGQICCRCKILLDPMPAKERYCQACEPRRRVYMSFQLVNGGWHVAFLEEDLRTSLRRKLTFNDEHKLIDLAKRGGACFDLAGRQAIENGILTGRGGVWLQLTKEQYGKLQ